MSTVRVQLRQWLDAIRSELDQVNIRLGNNTDPVELTPDGEAAYVFLLRTMASLERGPTILGDEFRRAFDIFTSGHSRAFRPRSAFLTDSQPDPSRYQDVARAPGGQAHTIHSNGQGQTNTGYVIFCSIEGRH